MIKLAFSFSCLSLPSYGGLKRTPCAVHTLQLVVNLVNKDGTVQRVLNKARKFVRTLRKSSVALEKLIHLCGLTLTKDCPTRWSSTYLMISRLLQVKDSVVKV